MSGMTPLEITVYVSFALLAFGFLVGKCIKEMGDE